MYKYVISLGEDCFMRALIDRYNIRQRFKVRMPFDGAIHPYEEMCRLIKTDFSDYDNNIIFKDNIFYGNNGLKFNHEKTKDINNFKNELYKRKEQFIKILNEGENILFLIHNNNKNMNIDFDFDLLENVLKNKYPNLKYYIFVFNNYHKEFYINKTENTTYLNIFWNPNNITNFNNLNYNDINDDFIKQRFITPYGINFTLTILKYICTILDEDFNNYKLNKNYIFNNILL